MRFIYLNLLTSKNIMDIITCLIYLFPQDTGWGDQANFIISSSQKGKALLCSTLEAVLSEIIKSNLVPVSQCCLQRGEAEEGVGRGRDGVQLSGLQPEGCVAKAHYRRYLGSQFLVCKIRSVRTTMQAGEKTSEDRGKQESDAREPTDAKHTHRHLMRRCWFLRWWPRWSVHT